MAGAKLASLVIGLPGPIEVDYQNHRVERQGVRDYSDFDYRALVEECQKRRIQIQVDPEELGAASKDLGEDQEAQEAINYVLQGRLVENDEKLVENGRFGKLFLGSAEKKITFKDIKTFIKILSDGDYFQHYPLCDVHLYASKKKVRLTWTT